jgi:hypothetical protein
MRPDQVLAEVARRQALGLELAEFVNICAARSGESVYARLAGRVDLGLGRDEFGIVHTLAPLMVRARPMRLSNSRLPGCPCPAISGKASTAWPLRRYLPAIGCAGVAVVTGLPCCFRRSAGGDC